MAILIKALIVWAIGIVVLGCVGAALALASLEDWETKNER